MPLSNVALTDTFDVWRTRTNQIVTLVNDLDTNKASNAFTILALSSGNNYTRAFTNTATVSANNLAGLMANSANALAISIGQSGNNYTSSIASIVGTSANNYSLSMISLAGTSANNYSLSIVSSVGTGANAYATSVGLSGNAYATLVGTSGNNYAQTIIASAYNFANSVNTTAVAAFDKANAALSSGSASASQIFQGTSNTVFISPLAAISALAEVALVDAANVVVNLANGINFKLDTIGGNRTLDFANISSSIGRSGYIRVKQDAVGGRTLATTNASMFSINGETLTLSTTANSEDLIFYTVLSGTRVFMSMARNIGT